MTTTSLAGRIRSLAAVVDDALPRRLTAPLRTPYRAVAHAARLRDATYDVDCPVCGYHGKLSASGVPLRPNAQCPRCGSLERHRQLFLLLAQEPELLDGAAVLHFAPERCLRPTISARARSYTAAVYDETPSSVDIRDLPFDDETFDLVLCAHVLEHVDDDHRALTELRRVLSPSGTALVMVPYVAAWDSTFEDPTITDPTLREQYFGQYDHVRYYGSDVQHRFVQAGFRPRRVVANEPEVHAHALLRGGTIFVLDPV